MYDSSTKNPVSVSASKKKKKKKLAKDVMHMLLSYTVCSLFLVRDVQAYACKGNGVNSSAHLSREKVNYLEISLSRRYTQCN